MNLRIFLDSLGRRILVFLGFVSVVSVRFESVSLIATPEGFVEVSAKLDGAITDEMAELLLQSTDVAIIYTLTVYGKTGSVSRYVQTKGLHYASLTGLFSSILESDEVFATKSAAEAEEWFSSCFFVVSSAEPFTASLKARLSLPGAKSPENPEYLWRGFSPYTSFAWPG